MDQADAGAAQPGLISYTSMKVEFLSVLPKLLLDTASECLLLAQSGHWGGGETRTDYGAAARHFF
jgi:hypothetical protein